MSVMTPAIPHAARSHPPAPSRRALSAETMKIPEPIIDPTTSAVASNRPMPRSSRPAGLAPGASTPTANGDAGAGERAPAEPQTP